MNNNNNKYDIFISYRREGGAQYARILQLMLQQRGYKVFLDYDELTDGVFGDRIRSAIIEAPVFMLVLSAKSLERCVNEDDWVRQEILLALQEKKHLIPINPDNTFDGFPVDTEQKKLPAEIRNNVSANQYSEIGFGQTLGITIDLMIKNRLVPTLGTRNCDENVDRDMDSANETLRRKDAHTRFVKRLTAAGVFVSLIVVFISSLFFLQYLNKKETRELEEAELAKKRTDLHERYKSFGLYLNDDLSMTQLNAIDTILLNMKELRHDTMWISKFEFTVGQWYEINDEDYDKSQRMMPMTDVSFGEIYMFLMKLGNATKLDIGLPSVEDWMYAAHGGVNNETTIYAGDDDVDAVAWYKDNSGGKAHPCDGQQGKDPNRLDLYDMSGNVSELCVSPFEIGDNAPYTICGGNYNSIESEVTISSREPFNTDAKDSTVGFRIIIYKNVF